MVLKFLKENKLFSNGKLGCFKHTSLNNGYEAYYVFLYVKNIYAVLIVKEKVVLDILSLEKDEKILESYMLYNFNEDIFEVKLKKYKGAKFTKHSMYSKKKHELEGKLRSLRSEDLVEKEIDNFS